MGIGGVCVFLFQAEDGIRDAQESRGLGDVYKIQELALDLRERIDELTEVDDLVLVEPLTGVRRVDEEERVLAVVGLDRLAVVLPQDAHVLQALGGLEVLLGVGRRAEVLLRRVGPVLSLIPI